MPESFKKINAKHGINRKITVEETIWRTHGLYSIFILVSLHFSNILNITNIFHGINHVTETVKFTSTAGTCYQKPISEILF